MPNLAAIRNSVFLIITTLAFTIALFPQDAANPWMMAPAALLSVYLILSGRLSQINLRDPVLLLILLLWLGWTWGAIFSSVPFASQVTLAILTTLPAAYLCTAQRDITKIIYLICGIVTALATSAMIYMALPGHYWRAKLFFDDENILGGLIAFTMPLVLSFHFSTQNKKIKILIHLALAILLGGLIATQSRSGLLGAILGIALVIFKNRSFISARSWKMVIPILLVLVIGFSLSTIGHRLLLMVQLDKDVMGRIALWSSSLKMTLIDPFHGVGLGIFHLYYPPYKTLADNSAGFWVHMDPLQWAVETGWGTALAFYALTIFVAFRLFFSKNLTQLQIGAGAALGTIFLIAHASYIFHYTAVTLLTGILLAVFASNTYAPQNNLRYIPAIALMTVLLCQLWNVMQTAPTLYFWTKAINASQEKDMKSYADHLQICIDKGNPAFPACRIEAAGYLIRRMPDPPQDVLVWLQEAEIASPDSPESDIWHAQYYLKKNPNDLNLVMATLRKALAKNPTLWPPRSLLVQILTSQKKYQEAFDTLQEARKWQIDRSFLEEYYKMERDLAERLK